MPAIQKPSYGDYNNNGLLNGVGIQPLFSPQVNGSGPPLMNNKHFDFANDSINSRSKDEQGSYLESRAGS